MDSIAEVLKGITDLSRVLNFGHHVVQKAHVFVKYDSSTPSCDGGRGFDDPRPGTEQHDQGTKRTPVNREKLAEALCWQPPEEAAVDGQADLNRKWADIRHLEQIVEMVSPGTSQTAVMSIPSPYFSSQMQGRSASSFRSFSWRFMLPEIGERLTWPRSRDITDRSPTFLFDLILLKFGAHTDGVEVTLCVQVDFLDLHEYRHPTSTLGKRVIGGRAVDSLGQLSPRFRKDTSRGNEPLQANIPGVRHRKRDNRYVAQVKPPGASGSVHIAQFKTLPEAARARDVGCYFYHKDSSIRMCFDDTPHLILTELASTRNVEDELSRIAGLSREEKLKFVQELAKKIVQAHHPVELPSSLPRYPKMMRTSMRADISQNRVQVTEQPLGGESSGFASRTSCAFELSELRETTSKCSDSWINEDGGTLSTDAEQRWLSSVILEDTSAASTLQLRSPHQLQIDQMDQHVGISTEASELEAPDQVGDMTLEYMWEGQDLWQPSVGHGTFGSRDYALSMTNQVMNLAASPSQVWSPGEDYSQWESEVQATAVNELGLLS